MLARPQELDAIRAKFEQNFRSLKNTFLMMTYYWRKLVGIASNVDHGHVQDKLDQWLSFKKVVAHFHQLGAFPAYQDWYYKDYVRRFHTDGAWVSYSDAAHELYEKELREHEVMSGFVRGLVQSPAYKKIVMMEPELRRGVRLEEKYLDDLAKRRQEEWLAILRRKADHYQQKCSNEQQQMLRHIQARRLQGESWHNPLLWEYQQAKQDGMHRVKLMRECLSFFNVYLRDIKERFCDHGREKRAYHLILMLRLSMHQYKQANTHQKQQIYAKLLANLYLHYCSVDDVNSALSQAIEKSLLTLLRVADYPPLKFQKLKPASLLGWVVGIYHVVRRCLLHFLPGSQKLRHPFTEYLTKKVLLHYPGVAEELLEKQGDAYYFSGHARDQLKQLQQLDQQEVSVFARSAQLKIVTFNQCLNFDPDEVRSLLMRGY